MSDVDPRARRFLATRLAGEAKVDPRTAEKWLRGGSVLLAHQESLSRAARKLRVGDQVELHRQEQQA
jgi:hypothetical protein